MNLYRILTGHISPKDSQVAIGEYLLAENDTEVFDLIKSRYYLDETLEEYIENNVHSDDPEEEKELREDMAENPDDYWTPETIIKKRGNSEDESLWEDAYYGGSCVMWELVEENISPTDIEVLTRLNIFEEPEVITSRLSGI